MGENGELLLFVKVGGIGIEVAAEMAGEEPSLNHG